MTARGWEGGSPENNSQSAQVGTKIASTAFV